MRYEVHTSLSPQEAITKAKTYFGPQGVGLDITQERDMYIALQGGGGHVAVSACASDKHTVVELETREWDYPVRQFMQKIA